MAVEGLKLNLHPITSCIIYVSEFKLRFLLKCDGKRGVDIAQLELRWDVIDVL